MSGIDESETFHPLNIAILTVSDTRDLVDDTSGDVLEQRVVAAGHHLAGRHIVRDEVSLIQDRVAEWITDPTVDVIITTGGTGFSPRDVTPEAIKPLFRREMDGFSILFHQVSHRSVGVATLQSRAFAGQAAETFVFCLPGSPGACRDGWDGILALELDSRHKPCSLAGMVPRLRHVCA